MSLILEGLPIAPREYAPAETTPGGGASERAGPSEFERLLRGAGAAIDRGEAIMDGAARGAYHSMDAQTLIALQAGIYRYSEGIDLISKLVDRVTSGARTILQAGH